MKEANIESDEMEDIFSDDELDEYLKELLQQQQRLYELSKERIKL